MMQWSKRKLQILIAVLTAVLISLSGAAGVMAKYTTQTKIDGQLTITADLGSIKLNGTPAEYNLLPGFDVDYPSSISITNKSPIPAYVFLVFEMSENYSDTRVDLALDSNWRVVSKSGAKAVYVYAPSGTIKAVTASDNISEIPFTYTIISSQDLIASVGSGVNLAITASMGQVESNDEDPLTVYNRMKT